MKISKILRISSERKKLLLEAIFYSGVYRYQVLHRPFAKIAKKLGVFKYETPQEEIDNSLLKDVRWAVDVMQYHVAWKSQCLDRAIAAKKMLNKRGFPCTLYMGVRPNKNNEMTAHAWLRCGTYYVTGGNGQGYAITGIYGDEKNVCSH